MPCTTEDIRFFQSKTLRVLRGGCGIPTRQRGFAGQTVSSWMTLSICLLLRCTQLLFCHIFSASFIDNFLDSDPPLSSTIPPSQIVLWHLTLLSVTIGAFYYCTTQEGRTQTEDLLALRLQCLPLSHNAALRWGKNNTSYFQLVGNVLTTFTIFVQRVSMITPA